VHGVRDADMKHQHWSNKVWKIGFCNIGNFFRKLEQDKPKHSQTQKEIQGSDFGLETGVEASRSNQAKTAATAVGKGGGEGDY